MLTSFTSFQKFLHAPLIGLGATFLFPFWVAVSNLTRDRNCQPGVKQATNLGAGPVLNHEGLRFTRPW